MTDKLFFIAGGAEKYPGPTYFQDFALMVLLAASIWNACLFHFLAWFHPPVRKYFAGTYKKVHCKIDTWEKIC